MLAARLYSPVAMSNIPEWAEKSGADIYFGIPIVKMKAELIQIAASVSLGRRGTDHAAISKRIARVFGSKDAAKFFQWELKPLTPDEKSALLVLQPTSETKPTRGGDKVTQRFEWSFNEDLMTAASAIHPESSELSNSVADPEAKTAATLGWLNLWNNSNPRIPPQISLRKGVRKIRLNVPRRIPVNSSPSTDYDAHFISRCNEKIDYCPRHGKWTELQSWLVAVPALILSIGSVPKILIWSRRTETADV